MIKGPFGLVERPFAKHQIVFDPEAMKLYFVNTGPFGGPRPFTKINPEVDEERVQECVISDAGRAFGVGSVSQGNVTEISDLPPDQQLVALNRAEKWCEGILEKTSREDMTEEEVTQRFNEVVGRLTAEAQEQAEPEDLEIVEKTTDLPAPT